MKEYQEKQIVRGVSQKGDLVLAKEDVRFPLDHTYGVKAV